MAAIPAHETSDVDGHVERARAASQLLSEHAQASFRLEDGYHLINPSIGAGFVLDDPRAIEGLKAYSDLTAADTAFFGEDPRGVRGGDVTG